MLKLKPQPQVSFFIDPHTLMRVSIAKMLRDVGLHYEEVSVTYQGQKSGRVFRVGVLVLEWLAKKSDLRPDIHYVVWTQEENDLLRLMPGCAVLSLVAS